MNAFMFEMRVNFPSWQAKTKIPASPVPTHKFPLLSSVMTLTNTSPICLRSVGCCHWCVLREKVHCEPGAEWAL